MAGLSVAHTAAVAQMVEHCSDTLLSRLSDMVSAVPGTKAAEIAALLSLASLDRARRAVALGPLLPMFRARADGVEAMTFPASVLPRLWKAASSREPHLLPLLDKETEARVVADRLGLAAAAAVRDQADVVWPVNVDSERRAAGLEDLAGCLDLIHLARRGLVSLPTWIGRPDADQIAELRLMLRDAATISPEGACRIVEIMQAHLVDPSQILRVVTQSSGTAGRESFLSGSEMACFVDRLIAGVHRKTQAVADFRPERGLSGVDRISVDVTWCAGVLSELDMTLALQPDSAWGRSVRDARVRVAGQLVNLLKTAEKSVNTALPMARMQLSARTTRLAPNLEASPDGEAMMAAEALLRLVAAVRGAASVFGFESDRKKLVQRLIEQLSVYADEALDLVNSGVATDEARALRLIERSAELLVHLDAGDHARTVRRRAAVAGVPANGAATAA